MNCTTCGTQNPDGAVFCQRCGVKLAVGATVGTSPAAAAPAPVAYAGFWMRFLAFFLDLILLEIAFWILGWHRSGILWRPGSPPWHWREWAMRGPAEFSRDGCFHPLLRMGSAWLYFALFESSALQATLGKQAIGIVVTDLYGRRVSFARATGRYFGKILSAMTVFVGFIMAGFTARRQALHDMLAECVVIRKR